MLAGTHAFGAILGALWRRARTGEGARLDVSMLECLVAADDATYGSVLNGGEEYGAPRQGMIVHEIAGRYVALQTAGGADIWPRLARAMGRPELTRGPALFHAARPPRQLAGDERRHHRLARRLPVRRRRARRLDGGARALRPRAVAARGDRRTRTSRRAGSSRPSPHEGRGAVRVTATPFHVDGRAPGPAGPAPYRVGEHTRAVLGGLAGYPAARIEELLAQGVAVAP